MSEGYKLVNGILTLTEEFNRMAEECRGFDPLLDLQYAVKITSPYGEGYGGESKIKGVHVKLVIIRTSGHGEESAYVLNDIASFLLADGKIRHIVFSNYEREELDDIELTESSVQEFIERIRKFCEKFLPPKPGLRS